jgi:hypothetical protein
MRDSGQLENPSPARSEGAATGATRGCIERRNGCNEVSGKLGASPLEALKGCEIRGNSKIHRRQSLKMQDPGKPGTHQEALLEGRGSGATRGFSAGSVDRMRDERQLKAPIAGRDLETRYPGRPGD